MTSLQRFVEAQAGAYDHALAELRCGAKRSHWMWFIFPQIAGLGSSPTAQYFAIEDLDEARDYLAHDLLGARLMECTRAVLGHRGRKSAEAIFGQTDAMKFRSSMTLFEAAGGGPQLGEALDGFCNGFRDDRTLALLGANE